MGFTALMRAALWGRANCLQLLINAGADKDAKDYVRSPSPCIFWLHTLHSLFLFRMRCGLFATCFMAFALSFVFVFFRTHFLLFSHAFAFF
jgi:hypothetical protein